MKCECGKDLEMVQTKDFKFARCVCGQEYYVCKKDNPDECQALKNALDRAEAAETALEKARKEMKEVLEEVIYQYAYDAKRGEKTFYSAGLSTMELCFEKAVKIGIAEPIKDEPIGLLIKLK